MKPAPVALALALLFSAVAHADTIKLTDGRTLTEAKVISASAGRVCIRHSGGLVQVEKTLLPPELAERYPADPQAVAAEDAKRAAEAEKKAEKEERLAARHRELSLNSRPAPAPHASAPAEIEDTAKAYAEDYFHDKYQSGSNDTVTFRVHVTTEPPEPVAGWLDQWRIAGEASFTNYRSAGWGSYQKESRRFEVIVLAPAGERPRAKDITLR
jgi:hypothetical protein